LIVSLSKSCTPERLAVVFPQCIRVAFLPAFLACHQSWQSLRGDGENGKRTSTEEIIEEKLTRDLSREILTWLCPLLSLPKLTHMRNIVLAQPALLRELLEVLAACTQWPDSQCRDRAAQACQGCMFSFTLAAGNAPDTLPPYADELAVLYTRIALELGLARQESNALWYLLRQAWLYTKARQGTAPEPLPLLEQMRATYLRVPGCEVSNLQFIEKVLANPRGKNALQKAISFVVKQGQRALRGARSAEKTSFDPITPAAFQFLSSKRAKEHGALVKDSLAELPGDTLSLEGLFHE
jgi:hypothetical protein